MLRLAPWSAPRLLAPWSAPRLLAASAVLGWIAWRAWLGEEVLQLTLAVALASFVAIRPPAVLAEAARLWRRARAVSAYAVVVAVSAAVFGPPLRDGLLGHEGDWPVNEAIARELFDASRQGRTAHWIAGTSFGDPTTDLYPTTLHSIVAHGALLLGSHQWIHPLLVAVTLVGYTLGAIGVARLALRGSTWPAAVLPAVVVLIDPGAELFTWGTLTTWRWGLLPSTVSIAVGIFGLTDLIDLEQTPTRARIVRVWLLYALTALLHAIGLLLIAAALVSSVAGPRPRAQTLRSHCTGRDAIHGQLRS